MLGALIWDALGIVLMADREAQRADCKSPLRIMIDITLRRCGCLVQEEGMLYDGIDSSDIIHMKDTSGS